MSKKQKMIKYLNVSTFNLVFFYFIFIWGVCYDSEYLRLKTSLRWKNLYVPDFFLNDISFKAKSEPRIKTIGEITTKKRKNKRSVFMIGELMSLHYSKAWLNRKTERQRNLKLINFLHAWWVYRFYVKRLQYGLLLPLGW